MEHVVFPVSKTLSLIANVTIARHSPLLFMEKVMNKKWCELTQITRIFHFFVWCDLSEITIHFERLKPVCGLISKHSSCVSFLCGKTGSKICRKKLMCNLFFSPEQWWFLLTVGCLIFPQCISNNGKKMFQCEIGTCVFQTFDCEHH